MIPSSDMVPAFKGIIQLKTGYECYFSNELNHHNPLHCLTLSLHILNIKMTVCSYYYFIRKWRQHSLGTTLMRSPAQIKI